MATESIAMQGELEYPVQFAGIFARLRPRYSPMVVEARRTLFDLDVPKEVRPFYEYGVLRHSQPSFMLLPMMYLAMADHAGGITRRHRGYLPWYMLAMELVAVLDDTVDRTPYRSGRLTYHQHFGDASAAAFSAFLFSVVVSRTSETAPEVLPLVTKLFEELCALQTWEYHSRYPSARVEDLERWLQSHYDAVTPAVGHSLCAALALHGEPAVPHEVCTHFGEVMQDVDDLVNFVEKREEDGENDDLKLGVVSYALVAAVRAEPDVAKPLEEMWEVYRQAWRATSADAPVDLAGCARETAESYAVVSEAMHRHGVLAGVRKVRHDARSCAAASPPKWRPAVAEMVQTFSARVDGFGRPGEASASGLRRTDLA